MGGMNPTIFECEVLIPTTSECEHAVLKGKRLQTKLDTGLDSQVSTLTRQVEVPPSRYLLDLPLRYLA